MDQSDLLGPVDTLVIEFPSSATAANTASALRELVDRGMVRLFDLMVVRKDADGSCSEVDLGAAAGAVRQFAGARSGLIDADDLGDLAEVLEPETLAVVVVYENAWAAPFVAAARGEGGEMVASMRLSAQSILDALDDVELTA